MLAWLDSSPSLSAGDARDQLHGEGRDAGIRHRLERGVVAVRIHDGDDQRALAVFRQLGRVRPAHLQHHVGAGKRIGRDRRARRRIIRVQDARLDASARLHRHLGAEPDHLLDGLGGGGDARLGLIDFGGNCDFHKASNGRPLSIADACSPLCGAQTAQVRK